MQRTIPATSLEDHRHFQYPRSDRRRCNFDQSVPSSSATSLSVSSVGSEAMQPQVSPRFPTVSPPFQYPRSDRRRCNQPEHHPGRRISFPFSILGRIGGDATFQAFRRGVFPVHFQYPRSDRRRCNVVLEEGYVYHLTNFQYPRSDRRRCNPTPNC